MWMTTRNLVGGSCNIYVQPNRPWICHSSLRPIMPTLSNGGASHASYAVHPDMPSHTGGGMTLGNLRNLDPPNRNRTPRVPPTKLSLLAGVVNDIMPQVLWTTRLGLGRKAQYYQCCNLVVHCRSCDDVFYPCSDSTGTTSTRKTNLDFHSDNRRSGCSKNHGVLAHQCCRWNQFVWDSKERVAVVLDTEI